MTNICIFLSAIVLIFKRRMITNINKLKKGKMTKNKIKSLKRPDQTDIGHLTQ